ncbi:unnamed protein product [Microthlaspi erraticum]|uniref:Reverse transcriptase zinc-binding domain-containing protein n=1 Tax=Microthlaspi erraticum TaxID=1685480 RepID=A0A6D2KIJ8_9BRAS|nr:unnamed protein product [Microthlaspi erraticum]
MGLGPYLLDLCGANGPRVTGISRFASVAAVIRNGEWRLPRGRHSINVLLRAALPPAPVISSMTPNVFAWRDPVKGDSGVFSSSQTWLALHSLGVPGPWADAVWFPQIIHKHAFIHWIAARDRLPTRDRLRSWGLDVHGVCLLCNSSMESRAHLFFLCPFGQEVWNSFFVHSLIINPPDFESAQLWVITAYSDRKVRVITKLLLQATINEVWRERNSRLHRAMTKPAAQVIREIQALIQRKLYVLDMKDRDVNSSTTSNDTYLSTWFGCFQR